MGGGGERRKGKKKSGIIGSGGYEKLVVLDGRGILERGPG